MKKIVIFLLIVIVLALGVGTYFAVNYFVKPRIVEVQIEGTNFTYCNDPDGNDIYTKAKSSYSSSGENGRTGSMEDICDYDNNKTTNRVGLVREGICDGQAFKTVLMTCGWGYVCRNATCVKGTKDTGICYDSDGGKNINKKGDIVGYGGIGDDSCWVSTDGTTENGGGTDVCETEFTTNGRCYVSEYYCEGDSKKNEIIPCPNGCKNGACTN